MLGIEMMINNVLKANGIDPNAPVELPPGVKLLLCAICHRSVKVPEWQQMITSVKYGKSNQCIHPGELPR